MVELLTGQSPFAEHGEDNSPEISKRIKNDPPYLPDNIDEVTKDFVSQLLEKDISKRIGFENDADDLKSHPYFNAIDWEMMKNKQFKAPFKPILMGKYDVSNFDFCFTKEPAADIPSQKPIHIKASKCFKGKYFKYL
jgi:serine/threonine protein kinase